MPLPEPPPVPEPRDVPYPGVIELFVDATDTVRGIVRVREIVPVPKLEPLILVYPEWLPGFHSPEAHIELLAGLVIKAGDHELLWRRDPVNVYAFHVEVPDGTKSVEVNFQYLSPTSKNQGRVCITQDILCLQWNTVVLHPAGFYARQTTFKAFLEIPAGWQSASPLRYTEDDGRLDFEAVSLDVLVDSPLYAGVHFKKIDLDGAVGFNVLADSDEPLQITPQQIGKLANLLEQSDKLFCSRPFDRYEFLVVLSDEVGSIGVEHHRCCEISNEPGLFSEWNANLTYRGSFAHEYVHAWNGKFRRGGDSWQPCFLKPIRNSLMWVYEGLTQHLGQILSVRSGLWEREDYLNSLAITAAALKARAGRRWRPMSDTTRDPIISGRSPLPWVSWQRSEDYYSEGALMWLEIDTIIRRETANAKSLDDFLKSFFGGGNGDFTTSTYSFEDVVNGLESVHDFDWEAFIDTRLRTCTAEPPLGGIESGGYDLTFQDSPNAFQLAEEKISGVADLTHSLGLKCTSSGEVQEVIWDSPAFRAGLTSGMKALSVEERAFTLGELYDAVSRTKDTGQVSLVVQHHKHVASVNVAYAGGHRYPFLERNGESPLLHDILSPR
jgi:predicted metalloprotease with PDZ domain